MLSEKVPLAEWSGPRRFGLKISRTYPFRLADAVIKSHPEIRASIQAAVDSLHILDCSIREQDDRGQGGRHGVTAQSFNRSFKTALGKQPDWAFEVYFEDGVIYGSQQGQGKTKGFDFASFDPALNIAVLRNLCFGRRRLHDGEQHWHGYFRKHPRHKEYAEALRNESTLGKDVALSKSRPTVLGELQLGNWAILKHDVLKLLAAQKQADIDLYIYIALDGELSQLISTGTVSYEGVLEFLDEYREIVTVPTWVVGVDIARVGDRLMNPIV